MNHTRVERLWPCAATRTMTVTRIPGGALPSGNQNVCRPIESARAVLSRSPVSKCAMTVILACGAVTTETPTLVPVRGCRRVTDAVLVSGAGGGAAVGVGGGAVELGMDAGVPGLAAGVGFGESAKAPMIIRTTNTPTTAKTVVQTLCRAGQLLRGGCGGGGCPNGWPVMLVCTIGRGPDG